MFARTRLVLLSLFVIALGGLSATRARAGTLNSCADGTCAFCCGFDSIQCLQICDEMGCPNGCEGVHNEMCCGPGGVSVECA
jgi:hypothetical protein